LKEGKFKGSSKKLKGGKFKVANILAKKAIFHTRAQNFKLATLNLLLAPL